MLARLLFAQRGIVDYTKHKSFLDSRVEKLNQLTKENEALIQEINIIQNDKKYQKKLVRDQLGFLASDEYIIYFKD
jgi:cell division protein FtsB